MTSGKPSKDRPKDMSKEMTEGQRAYEAKRAARAGVSLDKWMAENARREAAARREAERAAAPPPAPRKPGLLSRLLDRAHKPL